MIDIDKLINDDSIFDDPDCMLNLRTIPKQFDLSYSQILESLSKKKLRYDGILMVSESNPLPVSLNISLPSSEPTSWSISLKFRRKRIDGIDFEPVDYKNHHSPLGWHRHLNDSLAKTPLDDLNSIPLNSLSIDTFLQICFKILNIHLKEDQIRGLFN